MRESIPDAFWLELEHVARNVNVALAPPACHLC
jgi:hypothetical protein